MAAVGAAEDHLADPKASDKRRVAGDGAVIVQSSVRTHLVYVLRGTVFAQGRELAPVVVAEHACRDDSSKVQAAAETSAAAGQTSGVEAPAADDHQG